MGLDIRQGATSIAIPFQMVSSTDGTTGVTGLTPAVAISKNGGSFASPAGSVAEIGGGWYKLTPSATDTNTLGVLILKATGTGAYETDVTATVVAYDPDNATSLGLSGLSGGGSGVQVVTGTVTAATSASSFTATLSGNAPSVAAAYAGRQVYFQAGTACQQRGFIQSVSISGSPGSYSVAFTMNSSASPAIQTTPAVTDTICVF